MDHWLDTARLPVVAAVDAAWSLREFERRLLEAHRVCGVEALRSNAGTIAMTLSGGLDSTLSLAMLRVISPSIPITAYTIGGGAQHPDLHFAAIAASRFRVIHTTYIPELTEREEARRALIALGEDPSEGDIGVFLLYAHMARSGTCAVIAHDGIDELMGGYWGHRSGCDEVAVLAAFEHFWARLIPDHLGPLERRANAAGVRVILPYLQRPVVECGSRIPIAHRTTRGESKVILRQLARKYNVPEEIVARPKRGFCDALDERWGSEYD